MKNEFLFTLKDKIYSHKLFTHCYEYPHNTGRRTSGPTNPTNIRTLIIPSSMSSNKASTYLSRVQMTSRSLFVLNPTAISEYFHADGEKDPP